MIFFIYIFFFLDEYFFYGKLVRYYYNIFCDYLVIYLWFSKFIVVGFVFGFRLNVLLRISWYSFEIWFGNVKCGFFFIVILYNVVIDLNLVYGGLVVSIFIIVYFIFLEEWKIYIILLDI